VLNSCFFVAGCVVVAGQLLKKLLFRILYLSIDLLIRAIKCTKEDPYSYLLARNSEIPPYGHDASIIYNTTVLPGNRLFTTY